MAWVGDSRAILVEEQDGQLKSIPLTMDHNLSDEAERARLLKAGGKTGDSRL